MPNRRKKSFRAHRARKIIKGDITRLERGEDKILHKANLKKAAKK